MKVFDELKDYYLKHECLHPRKIENKYTHEIMYVPCGTCISCLCRKSNLQTSVVSDYSSKFRYTYFSTLTYNRDFLPTMRVTRLEEFCDDNGHSDTRQSDKPWSVGNPDDIVPVGFTVVDRNIIITHDGAGRTRRINDDPFSFVSNMRLSDIRDILIKNNGHYDFSRKCVTYPPIDECTPYISYAVYRDIDLLMKRLRRNIESLNLSQNAKISYYIVSEYGPRTLRPHWHVLFFFDSDELSKEFIELVSQSWSLGNCDTSLSVGSCASYVASYVNSYVCLPDLYRTRPILKPRCRHSKGIVPNQQFPSKGDVGDLQNIAVTCLDGIRIARDGDSKTILPTTSYLLRLFPRFSDVSFKSPSEVYRLLLSVLESSDRCLRAGCCVMSNGFITDETLNLSDYVRAYVDYLRSYRAVGIYRHACVDYDHTNSQSRFVCPDDSDRLILLAARISPSSQCDLCATFDKLYRLFAYCRRFFRFWNLRYGDSDLRNRLFKLCRASDWFWSERSKRLLNSYFTFLEGCDNVERDYVLALSSGSGIDVDKDVFTGKDYCPPRYRFAIDSVKSKISRYYSAMTIRKIKHKEYNDVSGFLISN